MAGALRALRALLSATEKPVSQARDVGEAFLSRPSASFFERYREPAENIAEASERYGVEFVPAAPGKMVVRPRSGLTEYYTEAFDPVDFRRRSYAEAPSLERVLRDLGRGQVYEIDATASSTGGRVGSQLYPAILDAISGSLDVVNVPTGLTKVNEMRRNLNTAEALQRNPRLAETVLPIDAQLDVLRLTPEDYMTMGRPEKVGALTLAGAAKAMDAMDKLGAMSSDFMDAAAVREALRRVEDLGPMSRRAAFEDPALFPLSRRGIGPSTLKKMSIADAVLSGRKINPDLWTGLGKKEGGLV